MQYDTIFWNIFANSGMLQAYVNYKQFLRQEKLDDDA